MGHDRMGCDYVGINYIGMLLHSSTAQQNVRWNAGKFYRAGVFNSLECSMEHLIALICAHNTFICMAIDFFMEHLHGHANRHAHDYVHGHLYECTAAWACENTCLCTRPDKVCKR